MKRIATCTLISALLIFIFTNLSFAGTKVVVKDIVTITVDKSQVRSDVPPIMANGVTLVPVSSIFRAFNAEIGWFPHEKKVYIRKNTQVIWLRIGDAQAKVNDSIIPLQAPAMIYRGRTMVPLRFIAEALGARVDWNKSTQTITITTRETVAPAPMPQTQAPVPPSQDQPAGPVVVTPPDQMLNPAPDQTVPPPDVTSPQPEDASPTSQVPPTPEDKFPAPDGDSGF